MGRLKQVQKLAGAEVEVKAARWRETLRLKMTEMGLSQQQLADLVNKRFKELGVVTSYSQKNVSGWLRVGDQYGGTVFPRYEEMVQIAHVLGVSVEYMVGVTNYDSVGAEVTASHLGISDEAIRSLRKITREFGSPFASQYLHEDEFNEDAVALIDTMLTSALFLPMLKAMKQLSDTIERTRIARDASLKRVEEEHGEAAFKKAMALNTSRDLYLIEDDETVHDYWVNNEAALSREGIKEAELLDLFEIAGKIDAALDDAYIKDQDGEMWDLACRYQVRMAFDRLLDDMFPSDYQTGSDA